MSNNDDLTYAEILEQQARFAHYSGYVRNPEYRTELYTWLSRIADTDLNPRKLAED